MKWGLAFGATLVIFKDLYKQGIELLKYIDVLVDGPFVQAENRWRLISEEAAISE